MHTDDCLPRAPPAREDDRGQRHLDPPAAWLARASKAARHALDARGEALTRELVTDAPVLAKRLRVAAGTRFEATQSAGSRVLPQLAMEGWIVRGRPRGTWISGQYRWVPIETRLAGNVRAIDTESAQAELLRHWLAAFGPATETDLRWWAGMDRSRGAHCARRRATHGRRSRRRGRIRARRRPRPRREDGAFGCAAAHTRPDDDGLEGARLYLGPHAAILFDSNGDAGSTVWWDGRVVGGWSERSDGEIVFRLLEDVGADAVNAVEAEATRLAAWLSDVRFEPGFLPPFQRELAAS